MRPIDITITFNTPRTTSLRDMRNRIKVSKKAAKDIARSHKLRANVDIIYVCEGVTRIDGGNDFEPNFPEVTYDVLEDCYNFVDAYERSEFERELDMVAEEIHAFNLD